LAQEFQKKVIHSVNSPDVKLNARIKRILGRMPIMMARDRIRIRKLIEDFLSIPKTEKSARTPSDHIKFIEKLVWKSIERRKSRKASLPPLDFPGNLPIISLKAKIIESIKANQVVIISGETGSGKSTQIPKMCLLAGRGLSGMIGCTQPRRIAAYAVSTRISEELGEELGGSVGMKIRFTQKVGPDTYIKIMTDGVLLAETQSDPLLLEYDTLIIDEAHERNLNIDFILGYLKTILAVRSDLKLIITSATMDTAKISKAFSDAPVIDVSGRLFPIHFEYLPIDPQLEEQGEITYVDMAIKAVNMIRQGMTPGDILIFLPTEQDIRETCDRLEGQRITGVNIFPLFARLPAPQQRRIFSEKGAKIVVATNVAETSITIPDIRYVIDTGLARISRYVPLSRMTALPVTPIAQSSADQRAGRCGRVRDGICIRLYSKEDYESRPAFTPPEIMRANLAEVILRMLSLKMGDISSFPFLDRPLPKSVTDGFKVLLELNATERRENEYSLTERGRLMARLPLDPRISRMLIEGVSEGCVREIAIIASALSIQDPRERPMEKAAEADRLHAPFNHPDSDFMSLLAIWDHYHRVLKGLRTQNQMRKFCRENFLSFSRMREWVFIHEQILGILKEQKFTCESSSMAMNKKDEYAAIHRSILSGLLSNIAIKKEKNLYTSARGRELMLFPGSTLFTRPPPWIMAATIVKTSRVFARCAAGIEPQWIEPLAGSLCRRSYFEPHWEKSRGEVTAFEKVSLYGLEIVPKRSVSYGRIDPEESHRVFIRSALVEGDISERFSFLEHNLALTRKISGLEEKVRRRGILADEEAMAEFYSERLPGVYDIRTLKNIIKKAGQDGFLNMKEEDLIRWRPDDNLIDMYPDSITAGSKSLGCTYRFSPGNEDDGVTVSIPAALARSIPAGGLERSIPGLIREKITALLRALPSKYRKKLGLVSEAAVTIEKEMHKEDEHLISALARIISDKFRVDIPPSIWAGLDIPEHLKVRFKVVDQKGREIVSGRDFSLIEKAEIIPKAMEESAQWQRAKAEWEKTDLRAWSVGSIPEQIIIDDNLTAHPALVSEGDSVSLRLLTSKKEADKAHPRGVEALYRIKFSKELRFLRKNFNLKPKALEAVGRLGGKNHIEQQILDAVASNLFNIPARSSGQFDSYASQLGTKLFDTTKQLVEAVSSVLEAYQECVLLLESLENANRGNHGALSSCAKVRTELERLVPTDFIIGYESIRLKDIPRYIRALMIRAQRAVNNPSKDMEKERDLLKILDLYAEIQKDCGLPFSNERKRATEEFRWMLEEFKISLFAQELKTRYPVSLKRLEKKGSDILRML